MFRLLSLVEDQAELRSFAEEALGDLARLDDDRGRRPAPHAARCCSTLNLNVAETSRALHFHYNTLRYRITQAGADARAVHPRPAPAADPAPGPAGAADARLIASGSRSEVREFSRRTPATQPRPICTITRQSNCRYSPVPTSSPGPSFGRSRPPPARPFMQVRYSGPSRGARRPQPTGGAMAFSWTLHGDGKTLAPGEVVRPDETARLGSHGRPRRAARGGDVRRDVRLPPGDGPEPATGDHDERASRRSVSC